MEAVNHKNALHGQVLRWPIINGLAVILFFATVTTWPLEEFVFSIIFLVWVIPALTLIVTLLIATLCTAALMAFRRRWISSASALAFPACLLLTPLACMASNYAADQFHLNLYRRTYLARIDAAARIDGGKLVVFDWGGDAMIGFDRFLIFDESDEISLPTASQSDTFREKLSQHGFSRAEHFHIIRKLGSHFFVVDL